MNFRRGILLMVLATLACCRPSGFPKKADLIREFEARHPSAQVLAAVVGEGDSHHAYWHFRYTDHGMEKDCVWLVKWTEAKGWEITPTDGGSNSP